MLVWLRHLGRVSRDSDEDTLWMNYASVVFLKKNSRDELYLWLDFFKRVRKVAVLLYALDYQINIYTLSYVNAILSIC